MALTSLRELGECGSDSGWRKTRNSKHSLICKLGVTPAGSTSVVRESPRDLGEDDSDEWAAGTAANRRDHASSEEGSRHLRVSRCGTLGERGSGVERQA